MGVARIMLQEAMKSGRKLKFSIHRRTIRNGSLIADGWSESFESFILFFFLSSFVHSSSLQ